MPQDFNLDQFKSTYFEECQELLVAAEEYLAILSRQLDKTDTETLNAVFRCIHSIKGGAGTFNFTDLVSFAHVFETVLDLLRDHKIILDRELADILVRSNDIMADLVGAAQADETLPQSHYSDLMAALNAYSHPKKTPLNNASGADEATEKPEEPSPPVIDYDKTPEEEEEQGWGLFLDNMTPSARAEKNPQVASPEAVEPAPVIPEASQSQPKKKTQKAKKKKPASAPSKTQDKPVQEENDTGPQKFKYIYRIVFKPDLHLLRFANEPLLLVREMKSLGHLEAQVDISRLPGLDEIFAEDAYLAWTFILRSDAEVQQVEEVFEFVIDDCELSIQLIDESDLEDKTETAGAAEPEPVTEPEPEPEPEPVFEKDEDTPSPAPDPSAIPSASFDSQEKEEPVSVQAKSSEPVRASSKAGMEKVNDPIPPAEPLQPERVSAPVGAGKTTSIRVELDRVDRLVNMVGELVITQSMLRQQAEDLSQEAGQTMMSGFDTLSAHTRDLQESVMAIRMQPVKSVFARIPRLVRELSARLGKQVDLITSGEMTEVDKTVIEQLMDPITHMIRNSIDHGLETPENRIKAGKSERGKIHLSAEHRSGRILIQVSDDGQGIDREQILQKAIEKGLVSSSDMLTTAEIDNLIFEPGFSTAQSLSDVSGRGVGMDVVRQNVVSLGGRISIFSTPGEGTRFLMSLPLTLAVLDGMIVQSGPEKYIVPMTAVIETVHPMAEEVKHLVNGASVLAYHEKYIRLVFLSDIFSLRGAVKNPCDGLVVIVETERFGHVGLVIDDLLGQQQVVIKSLEENYDPIAGIAAATILGNGKVALILDVEGLANIEHKGRQQAHRVAETPKTLMIGG